MNNDVISRCGMLNVISFVKRRMLDCRDSGRLTERQSENVIYIADLFADLINDAKALDVEPVVHARWIPDCETVGDDYFGYDEEWFVRCSRCGRIERDVNSYPLMDGDIRAVKQDYPYCHCGARMDGEA